MSNSTSRADGADRSGRDERGPAEDDHLGDQTDVASGAHLAEVEDGAGCTEIWETLSERREADRREAAERASGEVAGSEARSASEKASGEAASSETDARADDAREDDA